ncbi:flagellar basal body P-ring formation chaperone FlgA [Ectothiorhodospira variabilis]|uniref:flagellar basal body P-ring formation chaperone FlgA n=1 Tax=Ectothiorhodospira variabilis TaxID=505694 RepID=UPI001EFAB1C7|nr:flagellar basal body P-ring formation chaperone FlgA [Ectothiorhodospira variabilis]MCG5493058.1 flagellar basal body P-ring formation protein FlgA [Ectothiorhodospira variabilis]MCG5497221.1 flagellar basal body P-ring formation protein FlgA [Ectothiorhodospira variabilis]MCG5502387.1 flagellar basal body P-ring formation protein FlgA [Ectothiorhodospira variabilis]MCG5505847.1 flagellar basal body P-ring formation protein FlgA [Ectothiorhodospira variabilis]
MNQLIHICLIPRAHGPRSVHGRRGWRGSVLSCLALCALALPPTALSSEVEPHGNILKAAREFLTEQARQHHGDALEVRVVPGRLDPRLRLRACGAPLEAQLPPGGRMVGNTTVGVRCPGPAPWSLYVPMQINLRGEVVVLDRSLPRGTVLSSNDIRLEHRELNSLHSGYLVDPEGAQNMVLRRALSGGTVLTPHMVEPQRLVHRGERVTLISENSVVSVRMAGEAMADGSYGDRVRVRNLSSKRIVEGRVLSAGVVGVNM